MLGNTCLETPAHNGCSFVATGRRRSGRARTPLLGPEWAGPRTVAHAGNTSDYPTEM
ncbi:hypothetical protein DPMN_053240 [Dreissena polymorpha]|uniref:Uncharacterized protein n=1 Tax=Dreissena polymorpha TaxID=45954 RepID=A0A9D4CN88_DREPO|nr:hypothetical protein DPMN_053240 [Dreissena polymorpha]